MLGMVSWSTGLGKINVERERERESERVGGRKIVWEMETESEERETTRER